MPSLAAAHAATHRSGSPLARLRADLSVRLESPRHVDADGRLWPAHRCQLRRLWPSRLKAKDTVVIYAETSRPWMIAAYACWRQGFTVGTIYATLGEEGALFGINQSKCKAVVRLAC